MSGDPTSTLEVSWLAERLDLEWPCFFLLALRSLIDSEVDVEAPPLM